MYSMHEPLKVEDIIVH